VIELFVTDTDGCLIEPFEPYDLEGLAALRDQAVGGQGAAPALSVCSGRPYPYAAAITQALDITVPVLFESGGGLYDPGEDRTIWNPQLTEEMEIKLETVQRWFETQRDPDGKLSLDYAKRTQAGVFSPDPQEILALRPQTERFVAEEAPDLCMHSSNVSIDVVPPGLTKRHGLEWLADHLGLDLDEIAYIGDSVDSDPDALNAVGTSFAPANADEEVRKQVDHVTEGAIIEGVHEAYRYCLNLNEEE
jgi:hydroxymethylpyrimidine pyrophosphatase-like HAD family hydrolase